MLWDARGLGLVRSIDARYEKWDRHPANPVIPAVKFGEGCIKLFLYGLYWKRTSKAAVWTSFVFSTVVMLANCVAKSLFPALLQSPINAGAFCMIAGLILVPVVSMFTKAPDKALVENVFSCYDRKVLVSVKDSIGEEKS